MGDSKGGQPPNPFSSDPELSWLTDSPDLAALAAGPHLSDLMIGPDLARHGAMASCFEHLENAVMSPAQDLVEAAGLVAGFDRLSEFSTSAVDAVMNMSQMTGLTDALETARVQEQEMYAAMLRMHEDQTANIVNSALASFFKSLETAVTPTHPFFAWLAERDGTGNKE